MRRLAFAAAVCGTLVIAACSDQNQSPTEPSVPPPSATFGTTCDHGRYPLRAVALLIPAAFPTTLPGYKALRAEALLRVGAIALAWDLCRDRLARQIALKTTTWIDSKVTSTEADALKAAILNGFSGASTSADDYVAGVYQPGTTMIFTTPSGRFTMELRPGAFNIATLITVRGLPNTFRLSGFPEDQQPGPFWDIDATNSNTDNTVATHTLATPGTATIVTCFNSDGEGGHEEYPFPGGQWGHNPVGGGFEFVVEVVVPGNLLAELEDCNDPYGGGPLFRMGSSGGEPSGFAQLTWSSAGHYLARLARTLFLPAPLQAAMVGGRGPLAGAPNNLSPFGVVLPDCENYPSFCPSPD